MHCQIWVPHHTRQGIKTPCLRNCGTDLLFNYTTLVLTTVSQKHLKDYLRITLSNSHYLLELEHLPYPVSVCLLDYGDSFGVLMRTVLDI